MYKLCWESDLIQNNNWFFESILTTITLYTYWMCITNSLRISGYLITLVILWYISSLPQSMFLDIIILYILWRQKISRMLSSTGYHYFFSSIITMQLVTAFLLFVNIIFLILNEAIIPLECFVFDIRKVIWCTFQYLTI